MTVIQNTQTTSVVCRYCGLTSVASLAQGEDPDSFLRKNPPEAFQKILDDATGLIPFHVAHLREQEADPRSEGALGRIAAAVLQTIAGCRNEVHPARMLQETAELLAIPESALVVELSGVDEAFEAPSWIGVEATHAPRYYNLALASRPFSQWRDDERQALDLMEGH